MERTNVEIVEAALEDPETWEAVMHWYTGALNFGENAARNRALTDRLAYLLKREEERNVEHEEEGLDGDIDEHESNPGAA